MSTLLVIIFLIAVTTNAVLVIRAAWLCLRKKEVFVFLCLSSAWTFAVWAVVCPVITWLAAIGYLTGAR